MQKTSANTLLSQGGTFYNKAVLRAFEKISGVNAICPDISGIMGAFGAALIAKNSYNGQKTSMLSFEDITALTYTTSTVRCGKCINNCMLTVNKFPGGRRHITGNRCERGLGGSGTKRAPNMFEYKLKRIFECEPLDEKTASRGVIGIPRVLNMYENYPFWAEFFKQLGFSVKLCLCPTERFMNSEWNRFRPSRNAIPQSFRTDTCNGL